MTAESADFDSVVRQAQRQLDILASAATELEDLHGEATSPCGTVRAVVDSRGALTDLHLARSTVALSGRQVSTIVTSTVAEAADDAASERDAVLERIAGAFGPPRRRSK